MEIGDLVLFYHSNSQPPGVAGIAKVVRKAYPDSFALDPKSKYFDPKASEENPIWVMVDLGFVAKFKNLVSLYDIRKVTDLQDMLLLKKGMRLSIQPITKKHFTKIQELGS